MIVAATGHRPDKLGGYSNSAFVRLMNLAAEYLVQLEGCTAISGMALGWDQAFAAAAVMLSRPFIAAIPFAGQESRWPEDSQARYRALLKQAQRAEVVSPGGYSPHKMQVRNRWMVDHADHVLALWDGSAGGTRNCVEYALNKGTPVTNLYSEWKAMVAR